MRFFVSIITLTFFTSALLAAEPKKQTAPAAKPASAPTTRPASAARSNVARLSNQATQSADPKTAAITKAVTTLTNEFVEHDKDAINPLRKTSDYFKTAGSDAADVTPDAILSALERQYNRDLRIDAYIKWQLLSAVKDRFDPKLAYRALSIYQRAPRPAIRPGTDPSDKQHLQSLLPPPPVENPEVADNINLEWKERVFRASQANDTIIKYRNELFMKLPLSAQTIRAGLEDAYNRVMAGTSADKFFEEQIAKSAQEWAKSGNPAELEQIATLVLGVQNELGGKTPKSPDFFTQVRHDAKNSKINWERGRANFAAAKEVEELVALLNEQAQRTARAAAEKKK